MKYIVVGCFLYTSVVRSLGCQGIERLSTRACRIYTKTKAAHTTTIDLLLRTVPIFHQEHMVHNSGGNLNTSNKL